MKPCKLILIGCGQWGRKRLKACAQIEGLEIVAVYDSRYLAAKQAALLVNTTAVERFENIDKLNYAGVILSTSNHSHLELCQYFSKKGKYVLCEAPLVKTIEQLDTLRHLDPKELSLIMPANPIVYHPAVELLISLLNRQVIGEIYTVKISLGHNRSAPGCGWSSSTAIEGSGPLSELGPSVTSIVNLFGKIKRYEVKTRNFSNEFSSDDYAYGYYELENNILVNFEIDWNKWSSNKSIIVEGSLGMVKVPLNGHHILITSFQGETTRMPFSNQQEDLKKEIINFVDHINSKHSSLKSLAEQIYILPTILRKAS